MGNEINNKVNKPLKLVGEADNDKPRDFKAELAALINSNNDANRVDSKLLEGLTAKILRITDELAETRNQYLRHHNLTEAHENIPYDINIIQLGITYAIHECHKIISYLTEEIKRCGGKTE